MDPANNMWVEDLELDGELDQISGYCGSPKNRRGSVLEFHTHQEEEQRNSTNHSLNRFPDTTPPAEFAEAINPNNHGPRGSANISSDIQEQLGQASFSRTSQTMLKSNIDDANPDGPDSPNQLRTESNIRPPNALGFKESMAYAVGVVFRLMGQSILFSLFPFLFVFIIFGSTWFLKTRLEILLHFLITSSFLIATLYFSIFSFVLFMFGKERCKSLIFKLTIPLLIAHLVAYNIREIYQLAYLSTVYYVVFILHCCLLLYSVESEPLVNLESCPNRYEILSSDGTPRASMKGLIPFVIAYYVSVYYLIPFSVGANFSIRIVGRVIILPILFNTADSYQNNLVIFKSIVYIKQRMVVGNFTRFVSQTILRLFITNSPSMKETMIMSFSSSVFEIAFRSTYIPRTIYARRLWAHLTEYVWFSCCAMSKIENLSNISPSMDSHALPPQHNQVMANDNSDAREASAKSVSCGVNISMEHIRKVITSMNQSDDMAKFIIAHSENRSLFFSITEIQLIFFIPTTMFLCQPVKGYMTIQTFSTIQEAIFSLLIQLPFELSTQVICIALDNYFYGIKVPIKKAWKKIITPTYVLRPAFVSLAAFYLAHNPFWLDTEHWPKN